MKRNGHEIETSTRAAVERFCDAYADRDVPGMAGGLVHDVRLRVLGRADLRGADAVRDFLAARARDLEDPGLRIRRLLVDGNRAAALWEEHATTVHGERYRNHGVGVFEVSDDGIVSIHTYDDVRVHRALRAGRADGAARLTGAPAPPTM